jgi:hypothetical protein
MDDLHQLFEKKVRKYGIDRFLPLLICESNLTEREEDEGIEKLQINCFQE